MHIFKKTDDGWEAVADDQVEGALEEVNGVLANFLKVGAPSVRSWRRHKSRLYGDLKTKFSEHIDVTWKLTAPDAAELTAKAYEKLIKDGILQFSGNVSDSIMGDILVYRSADGAAYIFSKAGSLMTRTMPGDRNFERIADLLGW